MGPNRIHDEISVNRDMYKNQIVALLLALYCLKNAFCRLTKVVDTKQKVELHKHPEIVTLNLSRSSWLGWFGRHSKFHYQFWTCARLFEKPLS